MKKHKGLFVPKIGKNFEHISKAYCVSAIECTLDRNCETCIFSHQNLKQFIEWHNKLNICNI